MTVPTIALNDGHRIPQLGFGVFLVDPGRRGARRHRRASRSATGTSTPPPAMSNEEGVGKAIAASGIARDELFVTTKLRNPDQGKDTTLARSTTSLDRLGLDYVDLYLIHWPTPARDKYIETWQVFQQIQASGRARSIGVSNFLVPHLNACWRRRMSSPRSTRSSCTRTTSSREVTAFAGYHDIRIEAWGPLGQGKYPLLELPEITSIASAHGKTAAQVVLRWHLQEGHIVFPKSSHRERMAENFDVFDFELSEAGAGIHHRPGARRTSRKPPRRAELAAGFLTPSQGDSVTEAPSSQSAGSGRSVFP